MSFNFLKTQWLYPVISPTVFTFDSLKLPPNFKTQCSHKRWLSVWQRIHFLIKHINNIIPLLSILIKKHSHHSYDAVIQEPVSHRVALQKVILSSVCCSVTAGWRTLEQRNSVMAYTVMENLGADFLTKYEWVHFRVRKSWHYDNHAGGEEHRGKIWVNRQDTIRLPHCVAVWREGRRGRSRLGQRWEYKYLMCYYFNINIKPIKTCNIDETYF